MKVQSIQLAEQVNEFPGSLTGDKFLYN